MIKKNYLAPAICIVLFLFSCSKSGNNYTNTDHTAGMITSHLWSGNSNGFSRGDTVLYPPSTVHTAWPKIFNRNITDTPFTVQKVNGYEIVAFGATMQYRGEDATHTYIKFDSVISGTLDATLYYYHNRDSMVFILNRVDSFSAAAAEYYQVHDSLHTRRTM
jgi:hypothetical protein